MSDIKKEIDLINDIKAAEAQIAELYRRVRVIRPDDDGDLLRQTSIARTEFESAFMRLVRSVARPISPWLPQ